MPWFDGLAALPARDQPRRRRRRCRMDRATNHQHPDHDTADWPPEGMAPHERGSITGGCQCGAVRYALHAVPSVR